MNTNQSITEMVNEIRDVNKEYPKRRNTYEEYINIKLNEIFLLLSNKIHREPHYQMRDKGFLVMLDTIEEQCDEIQKMLKEMNEDTWGKDAKVV